MNIALCIILCSIIALIPGGLILWVWLYSRHARNLVLRAGPPVRMGPISSPQWILACQAKARSYREFMDAEERTHKFSSRRQLAEFQRVRKLLSASFARLCTQDPKNQ